MIWCVVCDKVRHFKNQLCNAICWPRVDCGPWQGHGFPGWLPGVLDSVLTCNMEGREGVSKWMLQIHWSCWIWGQQRTVLGVVAILTSWNFNHLWLSLSLSGRDSKLEMGADYEWEPRSPLSVKLELPQFLGIGGHSEQTTHGGTRLPSAQGMKLQHVPQILLAHGTCFLFIKLEVWFHATTSKTLRSAWQIKWTCGCKGKFVRVRLIWKRKIKNFKSPFSWITARKLHSAAGDQQGLFPFSSSDADILKINPSSF